MLRQRHPLNQFMGPGGQTPGVPGPQANAYPPMQRAFARQPMRQQHPSTMQGGQVRSYYVLASFLIHCMSLKPFILAEYVPATVQQHATGNGPTIQQLSQQSRSNDARQPANDARGTAGHVCRPAARIWATQTSSAGLQRHGAESKAAIHAAGPQCYHEHKFERDGGHGGARRTSASVFQVINVALLLNGILTGKREGR